MKRHYLAVGVISIIFLISAVFLRSTPKQTNLVYASSDQCTFDSGTKYPLGDTTNSTNKSFDANNTDFYDIQSNYYFISLPGDDLSINSKFFQDAQADGNGYDLYPKLASVIGFIPSKVLNAYHLKHKTKNSAATGDDKPFANAVVEVQTNPNQDIKVPVSGYNILYGFNPPKGQGNGPAGLLMWTNGTSFVFQIGRADNPRNIFVYVFDVCVDKSLVNAYNSANAAGRNQLPELQAGQVIAKAAGDRVRIGERDNGVFVEGRTPYIWDTNYQKTGSSTYAIVAPSANPGGTNTALPAGVVKVGWPNPQDPSGATGSGNGGDTSAQQVTVTLPPVTQLPITEPPVTVPPVTKPPAEPVKLSHSLMSFTAFRPADYTSATCSFTSPFCAFDQVAQSNDKQIWLCTSNNSCELTATFTTVTTQSDGSSLFTFQVDDTSVTQDQMNKISCYKAENALFCFK